MARLIPLIVFITSPFLSFAQLTSLTGISSWAYQLQNISTGQIAADGSFELVVIDYSSDGTDAGKFNSSEISAIKNSGKYAISYISIGEAEDYRYYWQSSWTATPPSWLGPENPDWAGNYKVRYWDPQWQALVFDYVDTIIGQGFDGIYLDIVDAWYYWTDENPEEPKADSLMIDFVSKLRAHVDIVSGGSSFIILPQNGEDVLDGENIDGTMRNLFFSSVNGIGVEDVFYPGNLDEDNVYDPDLYRDSLLMEFLGNGKQVFSIEYLTDVTKAQQFLGVAAAKSYVPYYCTRELDQLCQNLTTEIGEVEKYNNSEFVAIRLLDLSGREIYKSREFYTSIADISSTVLPGIYLLQTITTTHSYSTKLFITQ